MKKPSSTGNSLTHLSQTSNRAERTPGEAAVSLYGAEELGRSPGSSPISAPAVEQTQGGSGGVEPLLDSSVITARKAKSDSAKEQGDKSGATSRRVRRFYQRFFTGVAVGGRLRFLTLTSSDEAVVEGLDIHRSWRCLLMRLRRRLGTFEYIGVREIKGDRQHLHLVFRGSYIQQQLISAMWAELHKSPVVFIEAMYRVRGGAQELGKYLGRQIRNRYWASYNWVFRGWVGWSRKVRQLRGNFPPKAILAALARLTRAKRQETMFFLCPELGLEYG